MVPCSVEQEWCSKSSFLFAVGNSFKSHPSLQQLSHATTFGNASHQIVCPFPLSSILNISSAGNSLHTHLKDAAAGPATAAIAAVWRYTSRQISHLKMLTPMKPPTLKPDHKTSDTPWFTWHWHVEIISVIHRNQFSSKFYEALYKQNDRKFLKRNYGTLASAAAAVYSLTGKWDVGWAAIGAGVGIGAWLLGGEMDRLRLVSSLGRRKVPSRCVLRCLRCIMCCRCCCCCCCCCCSCDGLINRTWSNSWVQSRSASCATWAALLRSVSNV